jgi:photosystem II stability/assembly factor-like uncharacterized protein
VFGALAVASCGGAPELPPLEPAPSAEVESLLATGGFLNAVHLTENGTGAAVGEFGAAVVTADAGSTWAPVRTGTRQSLRGVAFAGETGVAAGANGTVLGTRDGGRSWVSLQSGTTAELRAVAWATPKTALVVGERGTVLRSADAGRSWRAVSTGTTVTLRGVTFASASVAVAVGDDGVLLQSTDAGATWQARQSGTNAALRSVHFTDATTGVAVGGDDSPWRAERVVVQTDDGGATWVRSAVPSGRRLYAVVGTSGGAFVAAGERGEVIRTADGGRTWSAPADPAVVAATGPATRFNVSNWLSGIAAAGPSMVAVTYGGAVYRSTDAGAEWSQVPSGVVTTEIAAVGRVRDGAFVVAGGNSILLSADRAPLIPVGRGGGRGRGGPGRGRGGAGRGLMGVSFPDPLMGVAVGARGTIQRTVDGGTTWTVVESRTERNLRGVAFADDKVGIAVAGPAGTGAGMVRTDDGGQTWHEQPCVEGTAICSSSRPVVAVSFANARVGMAAGGTGAFSMVVIKTTDGGRTWGDVTPPGAGGTLQAIALLDERTAVAVGNLGLILHTVDGGATWQRRHSGTLLTLSGIAFPDASRGLVVGEGGTVLSTFDGGVTWRREAPSTTRDLLAVRFIDAKTAVVVGMPGVAFTHAWASGVDRLTPTSQSVP